MFDREEPARGNGAEKMEDPNLARIRDANKQAAASERTLPMGGRSAGRLAYADENTGSVAPLIGPANVGLQGYGSQELSLDNVEAAFTYQPMHQGQIDNAEQVRDALVAAAKVILRNVPRSPRRTLALQHLINARMDANCAISFGGRF